MAASGSSFRRDELLWGSIVVGAASATGWTYFNVGFVPSFLPFVVVIFALRRLVALEMAGGREREDLVSRYEIDPDREYTADEQIEILSKVAAEYGRKRTTWGALSAATAAVAAASAVISPALAVVCLLVAGYCLLRYVRIRRTLRRIEARTDVLAE